MGDWVLGLELQSWLKTVRGVTVREMLYCDATLLLFAGGDGLGLPFCRIGVKLRTCDNNVTGVGAPTEYIRKVCISRRAF